jgi:hypothetical protein
MPTRGQASRGLSARSNATAGFRGQARRIHRERDPDRSAPGRRPHYVTGTLAARERDVVETAAVPGDGGDVPILIAACQIPAGETLAAMDTAARFGFVDGKELACGRVAFPHMLTRQAVLDLTDPPAGCCCTRGSRRCSSRPGPTPLRQCASLPDTSPGRPLSDTAVRRLDT